MALATAAIGGGGAARMVVLRGVDPQARWIEFHTDARSPKVGQLVADPRATLLFWDPAAQLQLRAEGDVTLFGDGTREAGEVFGHLSEAARKTYRMPVPAGTPLSEPMIRDAGAEGAEDPARVAFMVARLTVERIDWLQLTDEGQRRAEILYGKGDAIQRWIAP